MNKKHTKFLFDYTNHIFDQTGFCVFCPKPIKRPGNSGLKGNFHQNGLSFFAFLYKKFLCFLRFVKMPFRTKKSKNLVKIHKNKAKFKIYSKNRLKKLNISIAKKRFVV